MLPNWGVSRFEQGNVSQRAVNIIQVKVLIMHQRTWLCRKSATSPTSQIFTELMGKVWYFISTSRQAASIYCGKFLIPDSPSLIMQHLLLLQIVSSVTDLASTKPKMGVTVD